MVEGKGLHSVWVCLVCGLLLSLGVRADVFAYVDSQGDLHISQHPGDDRFQRFNPRRPYARQAELAPMERRASLPVKASSGSRADKYAGLIEQVALEVGVEARLLHAVVKAESAYNPVAISSKGARGLMQLLPTTAERFGASGDRLMEPDVNLRAGARYLSNLLSIFNGRLPLVLAAYNAGEGAVRRYGNAIPPYRETQAYVLKVLQYYESFS